MNFQTYGPFEFKEWSPEGVDAFYESLKTEAAGLESAIGVYVVAVKQGQNLVPYYVGKTDNSFGTRLYQHFDGEMLEGLFQEFGSLYFFLMPRVTPGGRIKKKSRSRVRLKSIDRLEFALIGSCLLQNPDLLNKQQKSFHAALKVPGYINSHPKEQNQAAKSFSKMLGLTKEK